MGASEMPGRGRTRGRFWTAAAVAVAGVLALTSVALATPGSGAAGEILAEGDVLSGLDVKVKVRGHHGTQVSEVKSPGRVVVQRIRVAPGGHTGWHTHGGPAVVVVKAGALTIHDAHDPSCTGTTYAAGTAFVDPGDGHVHIGRNLGAETAEVLVTYLLPTGAEPRVDAPDPRSCPF